VIRAPQRLGYALLGLALLGMTGCRQDMHDQPRYKPLRASTFFSDERSARPLVEGTVARGQLDEPSFYWDGTIAGQEIDFLPVPDDPKAMELGPEKYTQMLLARGQERFNIYCAPCHSRTGDGNGIVVQRGYRNPPSFHIERLRTARLGHYVNVIAKGFGVMPDYAAQVPAADRWAIAAYIRALQFSQHATIADVPPDEAARLERTRNFAAAEATASPKASQAADGKPWGNEPR
jgi:mono/diheme cytochrome c family protein